MQVVRWSSPAVLVVCLLSSLSFSVTPDRIAGVIDSSNAVAIPKGLHPKAQAKYDQGPVEPSFPLSSITLFMSPSASQQAALNKLLAQLQDPKSANYHKWLTPAQYGERFGLSQNDQKKIVSWLKSEGFVIQDIAPGRNVITVSGTAGEVQSAFKAEVHRYNVEGEPHFANSTPIMIPAALQGIITGIMGVNDFRAHAASRVRFGSGPIARPNYYDATLVFGNFLAPADFATIYNIPSNLTGSNQKIAIMGETDLLLADLNDFRSAFGLPTITCATNTIGVITSCSDPHFKYIANGTDPGKPDSVLQGDIGEADLDVEWSAGVAPGAQIVYVNSPSPSGNGVFDSLKYAVQNVTATGAYIISVSYGNCERLATSEESILPQAVTEGITVIASAGDSGAADCDNGPPGGNSATVPFAAAEGGLSVDYPGSSTYVISAGGTGISLANDSYPNPSSFWHQSNGTDFESAAGYIPELAWNDDETWLNYCKSPYTGDPFCKQGTTQGVTGWVDLTQTANQTEADVQKDIWISAGGGGASNCVTETGTTCVAGFPQPSWQTSLKVPNLPAAAAGVRWVPDVSFLASPNFPGYIFCTPQNPDASTPNYTSTCVNGISGPNGAVDGFGSVVGGTSASAPAFAGVVALLSQSLSLTTGLGDIHKALYALAAKPSNLVFHQPTGGDNIVYCQPTTPSGQPSNIVCPSGGSFGYTVANADPTTGYNLVTGLGSVNVANLASSWNAATAQFTLSSTAASPSTVMAGNSATSTITVTPVSGSGFTGTVTFACSGATGITCSGNAVTGGTGSTTVTIAVAANVAAGAYNVNVVGTSGGSSSATSVSVTVTATNQSFTLSTDAQTYPVAQGSNITVKVSWTGTNGFSLPLTFSCSDPASESTCTGPTGQVNQSPISFTITTTAATSSLRRPFDRGSRIFYAALLPGLLGIVFMAGSRKRSLHGMRMLGLMLVLGSSTLWLGSCGGSSNNSTGNPGTPKQSYTFAISATTGGSGAITGNSPLKFTVTVQ